MTEQDYELLSAYLDEMLTSSEREALEARLSTEPDLRRELNALRQTVTLMRQLPVMRAPRNYALTPTMVADIRREAQLAGGNKPTTGRIITFPSFALISALSTAASVVLISLGLILMSTNGSQDAATTSADSSPIVAAAPSDAAMAATIDTAFANTGELSTAERLTASARTANNLSDDMEEVNESQAGEADFAEEPNTNASDAAANSVMAAQATMIPTQLRTFPPTIAGMINPATAVQQDGGGTNDQALGGAGGDDQFAAEEEMSEAVVAPMMSDEIMSTSVLTNEAQLYFDTGTAEDEEAQILNQQIQPMPTGDAGFQTATQIAEVALNLELEDAPQDDGMMDSDVQTGVYERNRDTNEIEQQSQQTAAIVLIIAGVLAAGVAILTYLQTRRGSA